MCGLGFHSIEIRRKTNTWSFANVSKKHTAYIYRCGVSFSDFPKKNRLPSSSGSRRLAPPDRRIWRYWTDKNYELEFCFEIKSLNWLRNVLPLVQCKHKATLVLAANCSSKCNVHSLTDSLLQGEKKLTVPQPFEEFSKYLGAEAALMSCLIHHWH